MSASTVSRRFIRVTGKKLKALMERDLSEHDFVAMFSDGKAFGDDEMVIAVGVTLEGQKVILLLPRFVPRAVGLLRHSAAIFMLFVSSCVGTSRRRAGFR